MRRTSGYWSVAGIYACTYGAFSLFFPHLTQYLLAAGFSGVEIGNVTALSNLIGLALGPVVSVLADRTGRHRRLYRLGLAVEAAGLVGASLNPSLLALVLGVVSFRSAIGVDITLRDRLSLHWLSQHGSQAFGSLRLWGSACFAVLALLGGIVAERMGAAILFMGGALLVLIMMGLTRVYAGRLSTREAAPATEAASPAGKRGSISPALLVILLTTILLALAQSTYYGWCYNYVELDLGGGKSAVGLFASLIAMVEVPLMLYADRLLRRRSAAIVWGTGMLFWGAGWLLLSFVQAPWQAMLLTLPVGIAQGLALIAPIVFVGQVSQPHNTSFNLALLNTLSSLGTMIGAPMAGWLFDHAGSRTLFQVGAGLVVLAAAVLGIGAYALRRWASSLRPVP